MTKKQKYMKEWFKNHREEKMQYDKDYRKLNQPKIRKTRKIYCQSAKGRYRGLKHAAKVAGVSLSVTLEQYTSLCLLPCFYCGSNLPPVGHGLDRVVHTRGYTVSNVRPCCWNCNRAKGRMSERQFKAWVKKLALKFLRL